MSSGHNVDEGSRLHVLDKLYLAEVVAGKQKVGLQRYTLALLAANGASVVDQLIVVWMRLVL